MAVGDETTIRTTPHAADTADTITTEQLDLLEGAGFVVAEDPATAGGLAVRRRWTIPDTVADHMAMLVCGLNPSPAAADAGIGFARPGNRFWPAALAAGIASSDRDPDHALEVHGLGMTDLVKRTTRRADELTVDEYRDGLARLERLARRHRPDVICFVGLAGWRAARDRRARPGVQPSTIGGCTVYVMPSTSGLNAHARLDDLTAHLRAAAQAPGPDTRA